jgi:lipid II:glycine glycyltransferase (peptidoglycan interpeptide bridge formation enzyme)
MIIKEISQNVWNQKAKSVQGYTFFCSNEWLSLTKKIFILKNHFLIILNNKVITYVVVQVDNNNLGYSAFIGYGGLITNEYISNKLVEQIYDLIEKYLGISMVRVKCSPFIKKISYTSEVDKTLAIKIKSDYLPGKKVRYSLRKVNSNLLFIRKLKLKEIDKLYDLYIDTSLRVKSVYQTPKKLFKLMLSMKNVCVLGVFNNEEKFHAVSIFMYDKQVMYYWWNMSDEIGRKEYHNYMLIYYAIKLAIKKNLLWFDMATSHSLTLELFKKAWGAKEVPFIFIQKR